MLDTLISQTLGLGYTIIDRISKRRMTFLGHINRIPQERYPKLVLESRLEGKTPKGRPAKRWMDCIKEDINKVGMASVTEAGGVTKDGEAWRNIMDQMARQSGQRSPVPMPQNRIE